MLEFAEQLTGLDNEVNSVIIGHVAVDHTLEQTRGCQDVVAFTSQCLAHQHVPLPTGKQTCIIMPKQTQSMPLLCVMYAKHVTQCTLHVTIAKMYTQHITIYNPADM